MVDTLKLVQDLRGGLVAAKVAANAKDDMGTCNFDAPMFQFDRSPPKKDREQYEAALKEAGLNFCWDGNSFGKGKNQRLIFGPGCGGQGNSRTAAAEAFRSYLRSNGWDNVSVYYQMD